MSEQLAENIAIIGLHGRFPGADSVEEFWSNLIAGKETISFFSDDELTASGLDPAALRRAGHYVPARGVLKDAEYFDAPFFGIHPKEAEVMDPQQRIFLETCWEALERAGYPPDRVPGAVGVYAGAMFNTYYLHALHPRPELRELVGREQVMLGNEKDYMATRVAYKLNLKGPAITLNTGCSSSLVAVCQACQSLLTYQCDVALAGGVSIRAPQQEGYFHQEGNIGSPDGHTRTFDAAAKGTVFSNGVTLVVLKRLSEALADGDKIHAVVKGAALNNDGSQRVSFGAPGVEGQSEVVALAQEIAGVEPDSVSYVEAHGTATPIGDPIEVAALTKAFRRDTQRKQFCALGSVKSNIGHLDAAAGTAGLIKTALALEHHLLPPSLHFQSANPKLELESSPFFVNATLRKWESEAGTPLRAGVSSFGTGGTNAHIVVEEAPRVEPSGPSSRPWQLLLLSAKTPEALESATRNLSAHLRGQPEANLADVAYTLKVGRSEFIHRRVVLCQTVSEAIALLETPDTRKVFTGRQELKEPPVVFMFPGQGAQYVNMGAEVYRQERVFREAVDQCAQILQPILGADLRDVLFAAGGDEEAANEKLRQTRFTQPALFTVEYALAQLWMVWGVKPAAMTGHSVGEYVAGCLSGVFSLEEALMLVARRAELVQAQAPGSMLAVRLPEPEIRTLLNGGLSIAAINSPSLCVISGPDEAVAELEKQMTERGVASKALNTSHAFHSAMMDPVVAPFTDLLRKTRQRAPQIPYVSNVTGRWITTEEATSPEYWAGHVRQTVRFSDGAGELLKDPRRILLEVGPGQTLLQLVRQHPECRAEQPIVSSLGASRDQELPNLLASVGRLWLAGAELDWKGFYESERRQRIVLPTYPFERKRYWPASPVEAPAPVALVSAEPTVSAESNGTATPRSAAPRANESASASPAPSRKEHLIGLVRTLVEELSGTSLDGVEAGTSFLEIGLDSLLLTQAATLFQQKFRVAISFRQLMEDLSTIDALATHLDEQLPASSFAPLAAATAPPISVPVPPQIPALAAGGFPGALEQLLQQQLQMTAQLLAAVRDQSGTIPPPTAAATIPPASLSPLPPVSSEVRSHGPFRPMDRGGAVGLTERQQSMLDALIARYTTRTIGSKRLAEQNRSVLADPRTAAGFKQVWKEIVYPIYTVRSDGSRVWDVDGNEYIDFVMGFGATLFGHRPPFVVEAIKHQLELGFEIGPIQPIVGETAALVRELTGMERVGFCNTGSEAVLAAMRVCRTVTGRDKIAMFAGAYHGIFDEVLARPLTVNGELRAAPIAPGIPSSAMGQLIVLDYGHPESLELIRRHGHELAAVLVEPVQSRRLDLQPREFLHELRRITEETGTALIFDEVVTGFRIHPGGAQAHFNIRADVATYGKVVGGGLPIGIVAGKPRFLDALDGGQWRFGDASFPEVGVTFFAGTFVRHPISIAVAKAVLEHLKREGAELQERVAKLAADAAHGVRGLIEQFQAPLRVAQFSSLMHLTLLPEFKHGGLFFYLLRERGIHIFENRAFVFTTAHSEQDVDRLVEACRESLVELENGGFLKRGSTSLSATTPAPAESTQLPLTEAQRELWLATQMSETAARSYNVTFIVHLEGELNQNALEDSFRELIARHDSLRTAFDIKEPLQRVALALDWSLPVLNLSELPARRAMEKTAALAREQGEESFDLTRAPLWRLRLVRLGDRRHALILTAHHLIADGWSIGVLLHELKHCYEARGLGKEHTLTVPLQMSQYVQILAAGDQQTKAAREAEQYWREQFASLPPAIELPADRLRPAVRTYEAARESVGWDVEFARKLKKISARQGTTPLNFLLAGFGVLIHRLTGQEDLVVGIPAAGQIAGSIQGFDGARGLVGHCVNLLPVRSECRGNMTFTDYLKSLKRTMLDAYEHQEMTLGRLLQLLNVSRDQSRAPLVQLTFNLDRAASVFDMSNVHARVEELGRSALVFDLSVNIVDDDRELTLHCDFNTNLFDASTIKRWLGHFRSLLEAAAEHPESLVLDLSLLTSAERRELIAEFNKPAQTLSSSHLPLNGGATLHELFEAQAARRPEAVALRCEDFSLTYGQLNALANRLARQLVQCGVGPDMLVGLCLDRSTELVIAVLAILKAGGAYLPIDLAYPADRLAFMLEDAQAPVLLTQTKLTGDLPATQAKVLCVDEMLALPAQAGEDANLPSTAGPDHLAYVIYTSGTTGKPKGSMITHRNVVRLFPATEHWYEFDERDVWTLFHSCAFDFSVWEIWGALLYGGRVVVVPFIVSRSPEAFYELLAKERVTVLNQTPSAFRQLTQAEEAVGQRELALRYVIFGGEALEMQSLRRWFDRHGDQRPQLVNMYGITETTVHVTYRPLCKDDVRSGSMIGVPIPDLQVYILDPRDQPVPIGVLGEMYVGGAGLARGYLNRRDLTAERFIPDLLSGRPNSRLYRTGDLARFLPSRDIEYLGRIDHQVKIRGFRVELGEIESVLCEHPAVREAVVLARDDTSGFKRLVAYLVTASPVPDVSDLRYHLRAKVPDYMVPAAFVILEKFPLTNNGKVDSKALPEPEHERPEVGTQYVAPQTELEVKLAQIWTEVLGIERVGVRDNFFELGGHSLLAVRTISRMRKQLDTDMPLSTFFEAPTVAEMATKVFELQTEKLDASDLALLFEGIESPTDDFTS